MPTARTATYSGSRAASDDRPASADEAEEPLSQPQGLRGAGQLVDAHGERGIVGGGEADLLEATGREPVADPGREVRFAGVPGPDHGRVGTTELRAHLDQAPNIGVSDV